MKLTAILFGILLTQGASAQEIPPIGESSAIPAASGKNDPSARPFSDLPACRVLDAAFFVPPSRDDGIRMLGGCLKSLSGRYGAPIHAVANGEGILLIMGGSEQAVGMLARAVALRGNALFGYPARVAAGAAD